MDFMIEFYCVDCSPILNWKMARKTSVVDLLGASKQIPR
jgi:hypothetical protein